MYTDYDYESWLEIHNLELTLAAQDGSLQVVLLCRNISAFSIFGEFQIAGFSVEVSQDPEQSPGRNFQAATLRVAEKAPIGQRATLWKPLATVPTADRSCGRKPNNRNRQLQNYY